MRQIEQRFIDCGLKDFQFRTTDDICQVFNYRVEDIDGYAGLTDQNKADFKVFMVKFLNGLGLYSKATIKPVSVHSVAHREFIRTKPEYDEVVGGVVEIIEDGHKRLMDSWGDQQGDRESLSYYLRFDYKTLYNGELHKEWLHVVNKGKEWY